MNVNDYYAQKEESIMNEESWTQLQKEAELDRLRRECQRFAEDEAAREAEADGYRRYIR